MARAGREPAIAHVAQVLAQALDADRHAELLVNPLCQIDEPPADDTIDRRHRTSVDQLRNPLPLLRLKLGCRAGGLAIDQSVGTEIIEFDHPIPNDLKRDARKSCRIAARAAVIDHGERQQSAGLVGITRRAGEAAKGMGIKVGTKANRSSHGEQPSVRRLESRHDSAGNPS